MAVKWLLIKTSFIFNYLKTVLRLSNLFLRNYESDIHSIFKDKL